MGKVEVQLKGSDKDVERIYEFMKYNTKGISESKRHGDTSTFTITI